MTNKSQIRKEQLKIIESRVYSSLNVTSLFSKPLVNRSPSTILMSLFKHRFGKCVCAFWNYF